MSELFNISAGSTSQIDINLTLDKDSESLLGEASLVIAQESQNYSGKSENIDPEKSSGAWRKIEDIIPF